MLIEAGSFCSAGVICVIFTAMLTPKSRVIKLKFEVIRSREKGPNVREKGAEWRKFLSIFGLTSFR